MLSWLRNNIRQLLIGTSLATSLTAVLCIITGVILALDSFALTDFAEPIKQLGRELLESEVTQSFDDFYSVFNQKGGWGNFSFVLIAVSWFWIEGHMLIPLLQVGCSTLATTVLGCCGQNPESPCTLLTYSVLLLVIAVLQVQQKTTICFLFCDNLLQAMAALILTDRDREMSQVSKLLLVTNPSTKLHCFLLPLFLVTSTAASLTLLVTSIILFTIKRSEDGFKHLYPI